jgi:hypothetical protein
MVFCGQCGSLLSPRDLTCPNCGAVTEPDLSAEDVGTDAPTIASSLPGHAPGTPQSQHPASPPSAPRQQKLVLRGNASAGNEPDSSMPAEVYAPDTPLPRSYRGPAALQSSFPSQDGFGHQYVPAQPAKRRKKGGAVVLLVTLLVLLVLLSGTAVVVLRQNGWLSNGGTPTPPTPTPSQQAQALVQQYYDDINKRDYQDAYNLWGRDPQHPPPTYDQFASGYANTQHDDITFGPITPNADGTVTVDLTIVATETTSTGSQVSTFQGNYIVGQQDGAWKLLRSNFSKV